MLQKNVDADLHDLTLAYNEQRMFDEINGRQTLFELTNLGIDTSAQNCRTIYAFYALGIIEVRPSNQGAVTHHAARQLMRAGKCR